MKRFGFLVFVAILTLFVAGSPSSAHAGSNAYVVGQYTYASGTTDYALGATGQTVFVQFARCDGKAQIKHWNNSGDIRARLNGGTTDALIPFNQSSYGGNLTGATFTGLPLKDGGFVHFIGANHCDIASFVTANP